MTSKTYAEQLEFWKRIAFAALAVVITLLGAAAKDYVMWQKGAASIEYVDKQDKAMEIEALRQRQEIKTDLKGELEKINKSIDDLRSDLKLKDR